MGAEFQHFVLDDHGQTHQFWGLGINTVQYEIRYEIDLSS
jgi:hypothetical protein